MSYHFSSESVSSVHLDKISDLIFDILLYFFLSFDKDTRFDYKTLLTTTQVIMSGEVSSSTYLDVQNIVRKIINDINYE